MGSKNNIDKINIYVSQRIKETLMHDAEQFEIFKNNGVDINFNKFLSLLIKEYYESFKQERRDKNSAIKDVLKRYNLTEEQLHEATEWLVDNIAMSAISKKSGQRSVRISLKPTTMTDSIITEISSSIGVNDYMAQYLSRMLLSYCEKPIYERERIIFRENTLTLLDMCERCYEISLVTKYDPGKIHKVIPYKLVYGHEEMFNYLLCQEYNADKGCFEAKSYRLARLLSKPIWGAPARPIEKNVHDHLEKMIRYAPQYAINEDVISVVELTEQGVKDFVKIYLGRPKVLEKQTDTQGKALYRFDCSTDQLFFYFRRFSLKEAIVLEPASLRDKIRKFHAEANDVYG